MIESRSSNSSSSCQIMFFVSYKVKATHFYDGAIKVCHIGVALYLPSTYSRSSYRPKKEKEIDCQGSNRYVVAL